MREAIVGGGRHASYQPAAPVNEEASAEDNHQEDTTYADLPEKGERLHAILRLQKARARVMEESTASFEQVLKHGVFRATAVYFILLLWSIIFRESEDGHCFNSRQPKLPATQ